jgi:hypothetical protein
MLDILQSTLNDINSPEFVEMIREAHASLDLFIDDDYQGDFVQLLMLDDAVDQGETSNNVYETTRNYQLQVLKQLGIEADPETRVENLTRLLTGIHDVERNDDPAKILERAALELHPPELLAEILACCTSTPPEEWLVDLHDVSQRTIVKIVEMASQANAVKVGSAEVEDTRTPYVKAFKDFKASLRFKDGQMTGTTPVTMFMDRYFNEGMDVGYPFVLYMNLAGEAFGTLEDMECAANLIGAALVSADGHDNPRPVIEAHLEHYIADLDKITRVQIAMSNLLLRYQAYLTTGVKKNVAS